MRSTNSTPSRREAADSLPTRGSLRARLGDERGFFSGSLLEPIMCIPMLSIIILAAFFLLNDTMKTQARTRAQTVGYQHAHRAFDGVVSQLRSANSITYQTPDVAIGAAWSADTGGASTGYALGETNRIVANMVVKSPSSVGSAPRDVTFRCYYAGSGFPTYPACARTFVGDNGSNWTCWVYPDGGVASSSADSGGVGAPGSDSPCFTSAPTINNAITQSTANQNNDFAWVNYDVGVFQFVDAQGAPVDPTAAGVSPSAVEFHPKICLKVPNCGGLGIWGGAGYGGATRPLQLRSTVFWRNRPPATADSDTCNDGDLTNDPPATILNPSWVGPGDPDANGEAHYIPNPDACDPAAT
jgi:type II secretory pathway pseudopilin PulG